jgi:hypothetical protein
VTPAEFEKFEPITKGPLVAVLLLSALAVVAGFYVVSTKLTAMVKGKPSP